MPTARFLATCLLFASVSWLPLASAEQKAVDPAEKTVSNTDGYVEFNKGKLSSKDKQYWIQAIRVLSPAPRAEVQGDVTVKFSARSMTQATAYCWQQPNNEAEQPWGKDVNITPEGISLDKAGRGSFVFPAEQFPNGPINVRIYSKNDKGYKDIYELQLFNTGGVKWNQGIPTTTPPGAEGLKVIFEDDFDKPVTISDDGIGATYNAHLPDRSKDFSGWPFTSPMADGAPFEQQGSWLRIKARKDKKSPKGRTGLISSIDKKYKGIWAKAPAYFECRFTAQSAIGVWGAFWTLAPDPTRENVGDELDIIECYGGMGKGNPNHPSYSIHSHFWRQKNPDGSKKKGVHTRPDMMKLGGKSYWSTTFHTYAVRVGLKETVYYFDDIEVLRHPTNDVSRDNPHYFIINLAMGGISRWPIDVRRYNNGTDMWVDYVRVWAEKPLPADYAPNFDPVANIKHSAVGVNFSIAGDKESVLPKTKTTGHPDVIQAHWNNVEGDAGTASALVDHAGKAVEGLSVTWEGKEGSLKKSESWGFKHGGFMLNRGRITGEGKLSITGIPYAKYNVYVYTSSGGSSAGGLVTLSADGEGTIAPNNKLFYRVSWTGGKFTSVTSRNLKSANKENTVVFKGNTAKAISLSFKNNIKGNDSGITGIQIIEVK